PGPVYAPREAAAAGLYRAGPDARAPGGPLGQPGVPELQLALDPLELELALGPGGEEGADVFGPQLDPAGLPLPDRGVDRHLEATDRGDEVAPARVVDLDVLGGGRGDGLPHGARGRLGALGAVDLGDRRLTALAHDDGRGRHDDDGAAVVLGRQRDEGGAHERAVGPPVQDRQRRARHDVGLVARVVR